MSETTGSFSLQLPPRVKIETLLEFLERGHGYKWATASKDPVVMILGRTKKRTLPDLALVNRTLYVSDGSDVMGERFSVMLDVLDRQSGGDA